MGTTGPEFFNVGLPDAATGLRRIPPGLGLGFDNRSAIQQAIDYVATNPAEGGFGYVYLPPGQYVIDAAPVGARGGPQGDADLYVPENVVLKFAPGAVLNIAVGVVVEIQGGIEAGLYQIFGASSSSTLGEGPVRLTGRRVMEVCPEWWGAAGAEVYTDSSPDSTDAIQSALNAAYRDRVRFGLPPIPVVLTSTYVTSQTLYVNATDNLSEGFILRGAQVTGTANTGSPTLRGAIASGGSVYPSAILFIGGGTGWKIENVHFQAEGKTQTCLWAQESGFISQGCAIRGCGFGNGTGNTAFRELVRIGGGITGTARSSMMTDFRGPPSLLTPTGTYDANLIGGDDVSGLVFDTCYFDLDTPPPAGYGLSPAPRGVVLNAANAFGIQFRSCIFGNFASSLIWCSAGTFDVVACVFQNTNTAGCDVYLADPFANFPTGSGVPPGAFTASQCESQSYSFLQTYNTVPNTASMWNTTLVNCRHVSSGPTDYLGPSYLATQVPPSIAWNSAGSASSLVLVGCYLGSDVVLGQYAGVVVDLGTVFMPNRGTLRGGVFRSADGSLNALARIRGHPGSINNRYSESSGGTYWPAPLSVPALRAGHNLQLMLPTMPAAWPASDANFYAVSLYPYSDGDVIVNRGASPQTMEAVFPIVTFAAPGTALDAALHNIFRAQTISRTVLNFPSTTQQYADLLSSSKWERVFGSEDYSGPFLAGWDSGLRRLTLDTQIFVAPNAVYEVVWDVLPADLPWALVREYPGGPLTPRLRAVGRDTIVVSVTGQYEGSAPTAPVQPAVEIALIPPSVQGGRTVTIPTIGGTNGSITIAPSAWLVQYQGTERIEAQGALYTTLINPPGQTWPWYLCLHFDGVQDPPWDDNGSYFDVRIRRLK